MAAIEELLYSYVPKEHNDDLDNLLTWLSPQGHLNRPPSLRIKQSIRFISEIQSTEFWRLLNEYYMNIVRSKYIALIDIVGNEPTLKFNAILTMEKNLSFPCTYIMTFQQEFMQVLNALRHYLVDNYPIFRKAILFNIKELSSNDDLDLIDSYIDWLDSSHALRLNSRDIVLDLIVERIHLMCEERMTGKWTKRYLVMETFNEFIETYWTHFAKLLNCPEDDHDLTTTVFNCFENMFIKIRTEEIYDIFIKSYPDSKPTILELKKTLRNNQNHVKNYNVIMQQYLKKFNKSILNPSITTLNALLAYIKSIECFLLLDPTGKYLKPFKMFVKPYLQKRKDLINIILYSILDLRKNEFHELGIKYIKDINKLSEQLLQTNNNEYGNIQRSDQIYNEQKRNSTDYINQRDVLRTLNNSVGDAITKNTGLIYENVLKEFLIWVPETTNIGDDKNTSNDPLNDTSFIENNMDGNTSIVSNSIIQDGTTINASIFNLLDILLDLCESKELFISEFLQVLTQKLLDLQSYRLDSKWMKCLNLLRNKYSATSSNLISEEEAGLFGSNDESIRENNNNNNGMNIEGGNSGDMDDFTANLNKIDVMLNDIRFSDRLSRKISQDHMIEHDPQVKVYPKFISPSYWEPDNIPIESKIDSTSELSKYHYNDHLQNEILKYAYEFSKIEPNKALRLCKGKGSVNIEVELEGKDPLNLTITVPQYSVIDTFNVDQDHKGYTIGELITMTNITKEEIEPILDFWADKSVLLFNKDTGRYVSNDTPQEEST